MIFQQSPLIEVRYLPKRGLGGRGVFARNKIRANTILEVVPCLLVPYTEIFPPKRKTNTHLSWYTFYHQNIEKGSAKDSRVTALALGYGSLYNHSAQANAHFRLLVQGAQGIEFRAIKDIKKDEEILINYYNGANPGFKVEK